MNAVLLIFGIIHLTNPPGHTTQKGSLMLSILLCLLFIASPVNANYVVGANFIPTPAFISNGFAEVKNGIGQQGFTFASGLNGFCIQRKGFDNIVWTPQKDIFRRLGKFKNPIGTISVLSSNPNDDPKSNSGGGGSSEKTLHNIYNIHDLLHWLGGIITNFLYTPHSVLTCYIISMVMVYIVFLPIAYIMAIIDGPLQLKINDKNR